MIAARLNRIRERVEVARLGSREGRVVRVSGLVVEAIGVPSPVGTLCEICTTHGVLPAEVVGFSDGQTRLMLLANTAGIAPDDRVRLRAGTIRVPVGVGVLGRVFDGFGRPIDGLGPVLGPRRETIGKAPCPLGRGRIDERLTTGVRAIDAFVPVGRGQRVGIFAGSGVGKSTLLGQIVRHSEADATVIALVGERGREVREFLEETLGEEGRARSALIVATSDAPPLMRLRAASTAVTMAEAFRDEHKDVLLVVDSLTRFAAAQREIGLAAGEPPTTRGYPPSVYTELPKLLERLGCSERGSITALLTVLVEGDDLNEPVADCVRAILDGHIVLSRALAERNHYPAIDVLASVSRVIGRIASAEGREISAAARQLLAAYEAGRDLIEVGAYRPGSSPPLDRAVLLQPRLVEFLRQGAGEFSDIEQTLRELDAILAGGEA
ncbi:MAG: FliI/YscN family ATPase [Planctomycetes bacterium]|nr:FliI/YscN family ATPase [Planctomycetota bacterium]